MAVLKLTDEDTGESSMDIVAVPEGISFQVGFVDPRIEIPGGFVSVIVKPDNIRRLIRFLFALEMKVTLCGEDGCTMSKGHGGTWHDDGTGCWPVAETVSPEVGYQSPGQIGARQNLN